MAGLRRESVCRRQRPKIPIIIATGYADLPPEASLGFPRLKKPYTQQELGEAIDNATRTRI